MDLSFNILVRFSILLLFLLLSVYASAQVARVEDADNASDDAVTSLDRRSKMFLHAVRKGNNGAFDNLTVEQTGVGLFDAFFASLSMILVSESCICSLGYVCCTLLGDLTLNHHTKKEIEEVEEKLESGQGKSVYRRFFSRFCTPIFLESFILTFLAEWGDRSQIRLLCSRPIKMQCVLP